MSDGALLRHSVREGGLDLVARGAWICPNALAIEAALDGVTPEIRDGHSVWLDMAGLEALDTYGAWLVDRFLRRCAAAGTTPRLIGVPAHYQGLLTEVAEVGTVDAAPPPKPNAVLAFADTLISTGRDIRNDFIDFFAMLGETSASLVRAVRHPSTFRLIPAINQLDRVGWQAIGIILLITFLIGCIIAQQGFFHFSRFGAADYVVDLVGILVMREIGVLIVAIMVAGRSGSSYTAEIGSMKMREEIDALRTMGRDPVDVLILPRVVALVIALPILTFLGSMAALFGGGLVAWLYAGMNPEIFLARLKDAITMTHFSVGIIKAPFMALVIGIVACAEGLRVKGSAESLGLHTTTSVVKSIFLVIVLDGFFAIFFASIGM